MMLSVTKINAILFQLNSDSSCANIAPLKLSAESLFLNTDKDPLLLWFPFGANHDGHWSNSHMKLQLLKDVNDHRLVVVFPQFDFLFIYLSAGHTKRHECRLSVANMNAGNGGKKPTMHNTKLHEVGPHRPRLCELNSPSLAIGDTQSLIFASPDAAEDATGPFWLSSPQCTVLQED
jgi:hypothetical protein